MHILIVDDEIMECETLQRGLQKNGHTVRKALSGEQALAALAEDPSIYDLIITDYVMPAMDGLQLMDAISHMKGAVPPVILVTGFANDVVIQKAIEYGCKGYIEKPFTPESLDAQIQKVMRSSGQQDQTDEEIFLNDDS